jgi:hypothetical protein
MRRPYSGRRNRGSRRRIAQIRFTTRDKWFAAFLAALAIVSVAVGAWLGSHLTD